MFFLFLGFHAAENATICVCDKLDCQQLCPDSGLVLDQIESEKKSYYDEILTFIDNTPNVVFIFVGYALSVKMNLAPFINRKISLICPDRDYQILKLTLTYTDKDDYSNTELYMYGLTVDVYHENQSISIININFKMFKFVPIAEEEIAFYPINGKINMNTSDLMATGQCLAEFRTITVNKVTEITLTLTGSERINITASPTRCECRTGLNKPFNIDFPKGTVINAIGTPSSSKKKFDGVVLTINENDFKNGEKIPFKTIIDISNITVIGKWPQESEESDHIITRSDANSAYSNIIILSSQFYFSISLDLARIYVSQDTNFQKALSFSTIGDFYNENGTNIVNLNFKQYTGNLGLRSGYININSMENLRIVGSNTTFPVQIAISKGRVSTMNSPNAITLVDSTSISFENIMLCNVMEENVADFELKFLMDGATAVTLPNYNYLKFSYDFQIIYSPDTNSKLHGFSDDQNCIKTKLTKGSSTTISITAISPTTFPVMYCIATTCPKTHEKVNNLDLENQIIPNFYEYTYYFGMGGSIKTLNFGKIDIPGIKIIIDDNYGFTFKCNFNTEGYPIEKLTINGESTYTYISSSLIYANQLEIFNVNYKSTGFANMSYCQSVICNPNSLKGVNAQSLIRNLIVVDVTRIQLGEESYKITGVDKKKTDIILKNIEKLTFVCENLIINPNNCPKTRAFDITIPKESSITYLEGMETLEIDGQINVDLGGNLIQVYVSSSFIDHDIVYKNGEVSYNVDYSIEETFCISDDQEECPSGSEFIASENWTGTVETKADKVVLLFSNFSEESPAECKLDHYDKKQLVIKPLNLAKPNKESIKISMEKSINNELTSYEFYHINIDIDTGKWFKDQGMIKIFNCTLSQNFKSIDLDVLRMDCQFENLHCFKSLHIKKILELSGELTDESFSVVFGNNANSRDLQITITQSVKIIYSDNDIQINNGKFLIFSSDKYDAFFIIEPNVVVEFECRGNRYVPNTLIKPGENSRLKFSGTWPNFEHLIVIQNDKPFSLEILSTLPLDTSGSSEVTVIVGGNDCKISGSINAPVIITAEISSVLSFKIDTIYLPSTYSSSTKFLTVNKPNIILSIDNILNTGSITKSLSFHITMDENRVSSIIINNDLILATYYGIISIIPLIKGLLKSSESYPIIRNRNIILQAPDLPITKFTIQFPDDTSVTHGFNSLSSCWGIVRENDNTLILYSINDPSYIEFVIRITGSKASNDAEIVTYDATKVFDDLSTYLHAIKIIISIDLAQTNHLILSKLDQRFQNVTLTIDGENIGGRDIWIDQPGSSISNFILRNVNINTEAPIEFKGFNVLMLDSVTFYQNSVIFNSNIGMLDTNINTFIYLKESATLPRNFNLLKLREAHVVTLGIDSIIVQENPLDEELRIENEIFEREDSFLLDFENDIVLKLEDTCNQTSYPSLKIIGHYNEGEVRLYVTVDASFSKITEQKKLIYFPTGDKMEVQFSFSSYPPPYYILDDCNTWDSFDPFTTSQYFLNDNLILDAKYQPELSSVPASKACIYANQISAVETAYLEPVDKVGVINVDDVMIPNDAMLYLYNTNINRSIQMKDKAVLYWNNPNIMSDTSIELHWNESLFPYLIIENDVNPKPNLPKEIKIILDEDDPDYVEYFKYTYNHNFLIMNGDFSCYDWMSHIKFESTDKYFSQTDSLIFTLRCESDEDNPGTYNLYAFGSKELPLPKNESSDSEALVGGVSQTALIGIIVGGIVAVILIISIVLFLITKKKYDLLLSNKKVTKPKRSTAENDMETTQLPPDLNTDSDPEDAIKSEDNIECIDIDIL